MCGISCCFSRRQKCQNQQNYQGKFVWLNYKNDNYTINLLKIENQFPFHYGWTHSIFRLMLLLVLCTYGNNLSAHVKLDRQPRFHFLNNATTLTPPQERKSKRFHFLNNSTTLTSEQQRRSKQLEGKWVF